MPIMKVSNPADADKWKKAIESLELILPIAEQEAASAKQFYSFGLETAQFWRRYSFEKTNDDKLRQIAEKDLQVAQNFEGQIDSVVPTALRNAIEYLKSNFSVTI